MTTITKMTAGAAAIALAANISLIAHADVFTQTYDVKAGETLYLKTDVGSLNIETNDRNTVEIEVEVDGPDADEFSVRFERTNDGVSVYGDKEDGEWGWNGKQIRAKFYITVPENYDLDLNTAGGTIKIEDLEGNIDAQTSGGSIALGDIVGNVDVHTSGGSIRVDSVYGEIDANTSGGSIKVEFKKQISEDAKLSTSGGSITAILPEDIAIELDAATSGGSVRSEFEVDGKTKKRSIRGAINGGGPKLTLHTSGGSVKVLKD